MGVQWSCVRIKPREYSVEAYAAPFKAVYSFQAAEGHGTILQVFLHPVSVVYPFSHHPRAHASDNRHVLQVS